MRTPSRPTIVDVARAAGVSPTTVSYVLSGTRKRANRISQATRTRVLAAVEEIGYVPNQSARMLRLQRASRVLFLGGRFSSLYSQSIAQAIEPELARHGLSLGIQVGGAAEHVERAITALDQHLADGLIIETDDEHLPALREAAARGHAIVAIGPSGPEPAFDVISNVDAPAIRQAMDFLVARGFDAIVLMARRERPPWEHRIAVASAHLIACGVPESAIHIVTCPHDRLAAHATSTALLPDLAGRVAVYAGSDVSAFGVLWAAVRLGRAIPEQVRIVGHGNTPETAITVPSLTSIGPVGSDFTIAAELIRTRLAERGQPGRHIAEPCRLWLREST